MKYTHTHTQAQSFAHIGQIRNEKYINLYWRLVYYFDRATLNTAHTRKHTYAHIQWMCFLLLNFQYVAVVRVPWMAISVCIFVWLCVRLSLRHVLLCYNSNTVVCSMYLFWFGSVRSIVHVAKAQHSKCVLSFFSISWCILGYFYGGGLTYVSFVSNAKFNYSQRAFLLHRMSNGEFIFVYIFKCAAHILVS